MLNYECEICKKQFGNYKSHYITHKNKKTHVNQLKLIKIYALLLPLNLI